MHRYEDYDNSFSSLVSSNVGIAPHSLASWNIKGTASDRNIDQCKSCTCCSRCGKKRLHQTRAIPSSKKDYSHPEPILPLSSSILNRSTSKSNGFSQRYNF